MYVCHPATHAQAVGKGREWGAHGRGRRVLVVRHGLWFSAACSPRSITRAWIVPELGADESGTPLVPHGLEVSAREHAERQEQGQDVVAWV